MDTHKPSELIRKALAAGKRKTIGMLYRGDNRYCALGMIGDELGIPKEDMGGRGSLLLHVSWNPYTEQVPCLSHRLTPEEVELANAVLPKRHQFFEGQVMEAAISYLNDTTRGMNKVLAFLESIEC